MRERDRVFTWVWSAGRIVTDHSQVREKQGGHLGLVCWKNSDRPFTGEGERQGGHLVLVCRKNSDWGHLDVVCWRKQRVFSMHDCFERVSLCIGEMKWYTRWQSVAISIFKNNMSDVQGMLDVYTV